MSQFKACGYADVDPSSSYTAFVCDYVGSSKEQHKNGPLDVSKVRFANKEKDH